MRMNKIALLLALPFGGYVLQGCAVLKSDDPRAFLQDELSRMVKYESTDKRFSMRYIGDNAENEPANAAPSSQRLNKYGAVALKAAKEDGGAKDMVIAFGKRDDDYLAEMALEKNKYGSPFISVGVRKENGYGAVMNYRIEF